MKAFIITLLECELGCRLAEESLSAAQKFKIDAKIYPAVLGYDSKRYFEQYNIDKFLNYTIIDSPGHQGCFLSHFQLWIKCVELNEPIMILEHDGIMIRELPDDVLDHFDDVLRLDAYEAWKPKYISLVNSSLNKEVSYDRRATECHYHSSGYYYVGAYGYLVKPSGAKKMIDFAVKYGVVCTEAHMGTKIVDVVNTTATVVKLHEHYVDRGVEISSTHDLSKFVRGRNSMLNATYISPSNHKRQLG